MKEKEAERLIKMLRKLRDNNDIFGLSVQEYQIQGRKYKGISFKVEING